MTYLDVENSERPKLNPNAEAAKKSMSEFLEFLDTLPSPSKPQQTPFPYGSGDSKPYGWFLK